MGAPNDQLSGFVRDGNQSVRLSRRRWLLGSLLGLTGAVTAPGEQALAKGEAQASEADAIARVPAEATRAGLTAMDETRTEHFLGLGDAPHDFGAPALRICEDFAKAFLAYFQQHGFKVAFPQRRLTVVMLKDSREYGSYIGKVAEGVL